MDKNEVKAIVMDIGGTSSSLDFVKNLIRLANQTIQSYVDGDFQLDSLDDFVYQMIQDFSQNGLDTDSKEDSKDCNDNLHRMAANDPLIKDQIMAIGKKENYAGPNWKRLEAFLIVKKTKDSYAGQ